MSEGADLRQTLLDTSDHTDRAGLESYLANTSNLRPILHDDTQFGSPGTLGSMSHRIWP